MVGQNIISTAPEGYKLFTPPRKELDLLNYSNVIEYLNQNKPDIILHAAGVVGGIQANIKEPVRFLVENIDIGRNLVMAAYNLQITKILNLGTSCMYPKNISNPLIEKDLFSGKLEPTNEGYAISKLFSQRLCEYINRENIIFNYKTIIPCNLYGHYDKFDVLNSHMIPSVIRRIHCAKISGEGQINIWGDGNARREFMYAEDFADFIWFGIKHFNSLPNLMNVGIGFDYSITEYYEMIKEIIGFSGDFNYDLSKPTGMQQKLVDISHQTKLGWAPLTDTKTGIAQTYQYYLEDILDE